MLKLLKRTMAFIFIGLYMNIVQAGQFYSTEGVAIEGYDTVAYFTQNAAIKGQAKFKTRWHDVTWFFSSKKHFELFIASPEKYVPQFGGYCALGAAHNGAVPTDPETFTVHKGKLYLNMAPAVGVTWRLNPDFHIERASKAWQNDKIVFY